jgi:energy-coupling factor transporter ATP-binding protein EcfA2
LLRLHQVCVSQRHLRLPVDFELHRGDSVAIVGPEASGKSTLLRLMAKILVPDSGTVTLDPSLAGRVGGIGVLFQTAGAHFLAARVWDEVAFIPAAQGLAPAVVAERTRAALARVGMAGPWKTALLLHLSPSQAQRVALAALIAADPLVLLADEPGQPLSAAGEREFATVFRQLNRERGVATVVLTSRPESARLFADTLFYLEAGRLGNTGDS